ncbi:MAG: hypothetical protein COT17_03920 [Elusimicrobia bacterium CG08_land_8_20_14_0_20_51_18]|nr:MAG: hypothetical protein COT17_03920 [Elusimicrobia bacterium CG08_land_8_20_14_0_20_51_18]
MRKHLTRFLPALLLVLQSPPAFASDFDKYLELSSKTRVQEERLKYASKAIESWDYECGEKKLAQAYFSRAIAYSFLEEYEKAVADYNKYEELEGENYRLFSNRAAAYVGLKKYEEALSEYARAKNILFGPDYNGDPKIKAVPLKGVCQVYCMTGEYDKAVKNCREAVKINPQYDQAYAQLGIIYLLKKDYKKSMEYFYKAMENANLNKEKHVAKFNIKKDCYHIAEHYHFIGWNYYLQGKTVSADKYFSRSLGCSGDYWGPYLGMALLSDKKNEMKKMKKYFEKALKLNPKIKEESYFRGNPQFPIVTPGLAKDIRQAVNLYYYSE